MAEGLLPPAAYPERKLRPEEPITRAEAALAVARLPGVKARPDLSPRFPETANSDLGPSGLSEFVEIWRKKILSSKIPPKKKDFFRGE